MLVITGYGYIKDAEGRVISKYDLPPGEHPLKGGYTYHEVVNQQALDKIEVYTPPLTEEEEVATLIGKKQRELAIAELQKEGKLDENGKLVK